MKNTYNEYEIQLLKEVVEQKEFYPTLSESGESTTLRKLANLKLVKWCPYPEEFYIITPEGKAQLERFSDV
jgi:hypothetical protein